MRRKEEKERKIKSERMGEQEMGSVIDREKKEP